MGVPTSEVGYTSAMPRREDHEVRKGHVGHWIKKILLSGAVRIYVSDSRIQFEFIFVVNHK